MRSSSALLAFAIAAAASAHAGEAHPQPAPATAAAPPDEPRAPTTPVEAAGTPAVPVDAASSPAAPASSPAAPAAPAGIEVTVEGSRAPPGSVSLSRRDIRELPGALGDPYRAIEIQPGVTTIASGMPYYYIRGAPPGNIGYFFNGIQVPLLFHVGAGPSVIPASMVQRVEMHLGPYPADIGRLAGAAIEAESAPPSDVWRGEGSLRFIDLGGVVEGPVDRDTHVLVGGHYAAGAALTSALVPSVDVGYADYQGRVTYRLGPEERFTVFAFGAYDYLASIDEDGGAEATNVLLDSDFHRLDLRYDREDASGARVRAALTLGLDQSRGVGVESAQAWKLNARVSLARPILGGRALLRAGADAAVDRYQVTPRPSPPTDGEPAEGDDEPAEGTEQLDESFPELFRSRLDLALGAWADALLVLGERSTLTPGVRVDHYTSLGRTAVAVDPRIVGRFGVGEHVRLIPAFGVASQLPGLAPLPALQIGGIPGGLQRSLQSSFGVEASVGPVNFSATAFRQVTFGLSDPIGTGRGTNLSTERFLTRSLGDTYGLELGARGALRRDMFFLASYTLSRSTRTRGEATIPSAYDRTHVAHVALLYDLGEGWRAGIRHVFYTGFPADEAAPGRPPREHPDRIQPFYRLDMRLSKRWALSARSYLGLVLDVQNATLAKEVFDVSCDDSGCTPQTIGPVTMPGIAIEGGF
ncbi:TonB-dependent receptor plug domain-containing protein [Sorangium cellulosum]|uniref:TonB-dependent receptor plug domain-containing protein n=1 Tax=Sorangium cellulosum TaxID=56 RepID=UPI0004250676|nr:TonB-dependent receptor [Sorangium cellulosum]